MAEALQDLIGTHVEIWSNAANQSYTDRGILEALDGQWCRIRIDMDEVYCFPLANVRLLKGTAPRRKQIGYPIPVSGEQNTPDR